MNPILKNQQYQQLQSVKNPRQQVLNMIGSMNPTQKARLKSMLPKAQGLANKFGINFDSVANEINNL